MTQYREILRLHHQGISQRTISSSIGCSRNTVSSTINLAKERGLSWPLPSDMTDAKIQKQLFPVKESESLHKKPDYEHVHREMAKSGVTLSLLWNEYCLECRQNNEIPFMYTQFCKYYRDYVVINKATMHISHKPGEQMEVDWAGSTMDIIDTTTGELIPANIFVAMLSCSGYAYVEAFLTQKQDDWIAAHVNAYKHFGGVTRILVPDNLKTGVDRIERYTPVINKNYHEMAEHYGTAVIPARVRKPKDKPGVEGTVGVISTWIIAALRNERFFSLYDLNQAIKNKLFEFNNKPFQKKHGSRFSVFTEEEQPFLIPLPQRDFELSTWKIAIVGFNYHIDIEKQHYSVPYEYIKQKVDVRLTRNTVEVFYIGNRIASHMRLYGKMGQFSTLPEHMPEDHRKYIRMNAEQFIAWAENIGENTAIVMKSIIASKKVEQQAHRSCMSLQKLADKYSIERLELACKRALSYTPMPSVKSVQSILATGQDKVFDEQPVKQSSSNHGIIRGAEYYGRKE
jgi:transposase